jgi:hypothetical protein
LSLPSIIAPLLWELDTNILKIWCSREKTMKHRVFPTTPFIINIFIIWI